MMYVEIADAINDKILTGVYQAGRGCQASASLLWISK